ncbi:carbonic anhydrase family protein [Burkholderia sp. Ax-1724]|uniref:carbonic anhydrase family protein n=1 Tax=Burkholderia sp. Ax-1724 TaxID=2608336 RepID=UPI001423F3DF|nr:carbonic anhydrase family protein [Burkholderia sp. Ax-1724]NIF56473.1 carbonic anhydrase family protein [Burkholderia sp. Ax-1724]
MSNPIRPIPAQHAEAASPSQDDPLDYRHQKEWHLESGESQSPIEIRGEDVTLAECTPDENDAIVMHVTGEGASVVDNGNTVQIVPAKSAATIRGRHFRLMQAHFHAPAEHTIDGLRHPLEGHFVFKAQDGRLAVIAVLYREGAGNEQFAALVRAAQRDVRVPLDSFDAAALVPDCMNCYYHYLGSLTTPPLSENVEWYVLNEPVSLSGADIEAFRQHYAFNARDTQPLNGRPLLKYTL